MQNESGAAANYAKVNRDVTKEARHAGSGGFTEGIERSASQGQEKGRNAKSFTASFEIFWAIIADGAFSQKDFSDEKIIERYPLVEKSIWLLLHRASDIAAHRRTVSIFRASVRGLHDSGTATGHDGEA